jgi:hypothetical protein
MMPLMTNPTISSIIAALDSTTPRRLAPSPLVERIVNVVPRDVEHSAAPAANACTGVVPWTKAGRAKDSPMGAEIPTSATSEERWRLLFRAFRSVDSPPSRWMVIRGPFSRDRWSHG